MRSEDEPPGVRAAMRVLALDHATAVVVERLRSAGIPSLLLKGASFARWLYDDEAERTYVDVDVLVPPSHVAAAEEELGRLGFARSGFETIRDDRPRHAVTLMREDGAAIDLHRTLFGVADGEGLFAVLAADAEPVAVGGLEVLAPSKPGRTLVLALHAAKDAGRSEKVRRDLARAISILPLDVWRQAADLARALDAVQAFAAGLRRDAEGVRLASELGLAADGDATMALRGRRSPPLAYGLDYVLGSPGLRSKIRFAIRKTFPPSTFMRSWSRLARRGGLGLAAAYVLRPFWLGWRSVPAIRAVLRARKDAGAGPQR